jgi:hypothetical protein
MRGRSPRAVRLHPQRRRRLVPGEVYAALVLEVTGEGLYRERIPPETVNGMAQVRASGRVAAQHLQERLELAGDVLEVVLGGETIGFFGER